MTVRTKRQLPVIISLLAVMSILIAASNPLVALKSLLCKMSTHKQGQKNTEDKLKEAWQLLRRYDLSGAEKILAEIKDKIDQDLPQYIEANLIYAAVLCNKDNPKKEDIERAEKILRQLISRYPQNKATPYAIMQLARIYELEHYYGDKPDIEKAQDCYRTIIEHYPHSPLASQAIIRLAATYISSTERQKIEDGIKIIKDWLGKHPNDKLAGIMHLYIADVYFLPLMDYKKAIDEYIKADKLGAVDLLQKDLIYWRIARTADKKLGNKAIAKRYYRKIIEQLPDSGRYWQAKTALERLESESSEIKR